MEFSGDPWCLTERLIMKLMFHRIVEHSAYFLESKDQLLSLFLFISNLLNCCF